MLFYFMYKEKKKTQKFEFSILSCYTLQIKSSIYSQKKKNQTKF